MQGAIGAAARLARAAASSLRQPPLAPHNTLSSCTLILNPRTGIPRTGDRQPLLFKSPQAAPTRPTSRAATRLSFTSSRPATTRSRRRRCRAATQRRVLPLRCVCCPLCKVHAHRRMFCSMQHLLPLLTPTLCDKSANKPSNHNCSRLLPTRAARRRPSPRSGSSARCPSPRPPATA